MKELEIEFKNMLSGQEYGRLEEKYFSSQKPVVQTNFYIDTPDLDMRKNRILLRIRDAEGIQMMTLKEPTEKGVMEYHGEVSGELNFDRDIRPAELPELVRGELARYDIDISRLKIYGALSTERRQVPYREGLRVLDRNTFLDEEDFDLEPTEKGGMEYHGEVSGELNFDRDLRPAELPELIRGELARYDIDISRLKIYGALSTERRQVPYREGLLVLDRNTFLDEEDFELEYEVDNHDKGETRFLQLLEEAGIERRGEVTKSERFYNKLASIRTGDHYAYTI